MSEITDKIFFVSVFVVIYQCSGDDFDKLFDNSIAWKLLVWCIFRLFILFYSDTYN